VENEIKAYIAGYRKAIEVVEEAKTTLQNMKDDNNEETGLARYTAKFVFEVLLPTMRVRLGNIVKEGCYDEQRG